MANCPIESDLDLIIIMYLQEKRTKILYVTIHQCRLSGITDLIRKEEPPE